MKDLKRSSSEEDSVTGLVVLAEGDGELALGVLHAVALVDDDVVPVDLGEVGLVVQNKVISREDDVELSLGDLGLVEVLAHGLRSLVDDGDDRRSPFGKLTRPVVERRERGDDEEGTVVALLLHEVGDEGNRLDCLSKTHLISQHSVEVVVVERHEPLQTDDLVGLQLASNEDAGLDLNALFDGVRNGVVVLGGTSSRGRSFLFFRSKRRCLITFIIALSSLGLIELVLFSNLPLDLSVVILFSTTFSVVHSSGLSDLGSDLTKKVIGLRDELQDTLVLGLFEELQVAFFVVLSEGLDTVLGLLVTHLLLALLLGLVELDDLARHSLQTSTRLCVDLLDFLLVHDDRVDKVPVQLCLLLILIQLDPLALLQSGLTVDLLLFKKIKKMMMKMMKLSVLSLFFFFFFF